MKLPEVKLSSRKAKKKACYQVARALRAKGHTYREIGDTLGISYPTARAWTIDVPKGDLMVSE